MAYILCLEAKDVSVQRRMSRWCKSMDDWIFKRIVFWHGVQNKNSTKRLEIL